MAADVDALEHRIREQAYYLWEASGRPAGRDEEFWHQARDVITTGKPKPKRRLSARPRSRSRKSA